MALDKVKIKKKNFAIKRKAYAEQPPPKYELFNIATAGAKAEKDYIESVNRRLKIYKTIFEVYAKLSLLNKDLKDQHEGGKTMQLQEVFIFLRDFKISMTDQKGRDQIKAMVKLVNSKLSDQQQDAKGVVKYDLDLVGFIEFMLQLGSSSLLYKEHSRVPTEFMNQLFGHLRANNLHHPQINRLFVQVDKLAEKQLIKDLN